jgi:hypothetical protein
VSKGKRRRRALNRKRRIRRAQQLLDACAEQQDWLANHPEIVLLMRATAIMIERMMGEARLEAVAQRAGARAPKRKEPAE